MKKYLFKLLYLAILAVVFLGLSGGLACELDSGGPWFWNDDRLINETKEIVLVKIISHSKKNTFDTNYDGKIIEVLKTSEPSKFYKGSLLSLKNFAPPQFEPPVGDRKKGRASHTKSCTVLTSFEDRKTYLVFYNSFHPKGYEEVKNTSGDLWYKNVKQQLKRESVQQENFPADR